jgi:hypothetical protein
MSWSTRVGPRRPSVASKSSRRLRDRDAGLKGKVWTASRAMSLKISAGTQEVWPWPSVSPTGSCAKDRRPRTVSGRPIEHSRVGNPYHAVSVLAGPHSCEAAKEIEGRRFLSSGAPMLPLKACTQSTCHCRYVHHSDRRSSGDRRMRIHNRTPTRWPTGAPATAVASTTDGSQRTLNSSDCSPCRASSL